ncbi:MAG: response regulator [Bacteroidales bacterium]|nr:response regulator [Bacteroidales bacterium]
MDDILHIVLIEDEKKSLNLLETLLEQVKGIQIDGSFTNPEEGLIYLTEHQPDLIILDIRMPKLNGLDLIEQLRKRHIFVPFIFITAHDEFILDALRKKAVDYLLKPVSLETLRNCIKKFRSDYFRKNGVDSEIKANDLNSELLRINIKSGFEIVKTADILCMIADGRYTNFILVNKKEITVSQNLGNFDYLVGQNGFLRIHRSVTINPIHIRRLNRITRICLLEGDGFEYKVKTSTQGIKLLEQYFADLK